MATIDDGEQVRVEASETDDGAGPHGWVRIVLAVALGLLAGAVIALLLPREDGPRRAAPTVADPVPAETASPVETAPPAGSTAVEGGPDPAIEE